MPATAWSQSAEVATSWGNSPYISNLGVLMNDTVYLMNDTVATINDQKANPIMGQPTTFTNSSPSATAWTRT